MPKVVAGEAGIVGGFADGAYRKPRLVALRAAAMPPNPPAGGLT